MQLMFKILIPGQGFSDSGVTVWVFTSPHSSHIDGVWERMIGETSRILNSMMKEHSAQGITHEVLTTFPAETSAIINSRPLTSIPSDPDSSFILTSSILLTQKTDTVSEVVCDTNAKDLLKIQWRRTLIKKNYSKL